MSEQHDIALQAETRTEKKKKTSRLREKGIIPAVMYGHKKDNKNIQIEEQAFLKAYENAGESTLIDLTIDSESPVKVLIHDLDKDPVSDKVIHIDFFAVNMEEEIHAEVVLHFINESVAVKTLGGTLVKNRDHVSVKCLPKNLIREVQVDISALNTFEDAIHVSDLQIPDTITVLDDPERVVAIVTPPRTEEELAELDEEISVDVSKVEGVEKPEDAEGEGEEAAKDGKKEDGKESSESKE